MTFIPIGTVPLQEAESTLDASCDAMLGRIVFIETIPGWGWVHRGHSLYPDYPNLPAPFHVRIRTYYAFRMNARRGFFATIEEAGHPLNGFDMVCCTRHCGRFNFTDRPAN